MDNAKYIFLTYEMTKLLWGLYLRKQELEEIWLQVGECDQPLQSNVSGQVRHWDSQGAVAKPAFYR